VRFRSQPEAELCVTLKTYLKGVPFYNALESRGVCGISTRGGKVKKPTFPLRLDSSTFALNRNECHDFTVNRPRPGEILELDQKSVSNFLSLGHHQHACPSSDLLLQDHPGSQFCCGDLAQLFDINSIKRCKEMYRVVGAAAILPERIQGDSSVSHELGSIPGVGPWRSPKLVPGCSGIMVNLSVRLCFFCQSQKRRSTKQ
jgi:hypothetical protein